VIFIASQVEAAISDFVAIKKEYIEIKDMVWYNICSIET
jgi:hypothetical protein